MRLAVGYVRTSGTTNPESSIPNQINQITEYCKQNNIVLLTVLIDEKKSGTKLDGRENYQQLKRLINERAVDCVIVSYSDRLARDSFEFVLTLAEMKSKNIEFISISEQIKGSNLSPLEMVQMGILNDMENQARAKRMSEAKSISTKQGNYPFRTPFGYKVVNKKLVMDENNAPIVKKIFEMYLNNSTVPEILKYFRDNNITKNGKEWKHYEVHNILRSKTYTGQIYNRTQNIRLSEVSHDVFIKEQDHEKIIKLIESRKKTTPVDKGFNIMAKGVFKCFNCNSNMKMIYDSYLCELGARCQKVSVILVQELLYSYFEHSFIEKMEKEKANIEIKKELLLKQKNKIEIRFARAELEIEKFQNRIEKISKELMLLYKSYANPSVHFELMDHVKNKNEKAIKQYLKDNKLSFVYLQKENILKLV